MKKFILTMIFLLPFMAQAETTGDLPFTESDEEVTTATRTANCYDPTTESRILEIYGEAFVQRIQPLLQEAYEQNGVDPRIIYHRMVGEGLGDPEIRNPSSGAYGIFQVLGSYMGQGSHQSRIRELYNQHNASTTEAKRYVQVLYHVRHYIREGIASLGGWVGCGSGTGQNRFNSMTSMQQVAYLGWGSCGSAAIQAEQHIHNGGVASYDTSIIRSLTIANQPLCPFE